jgi:hypothetical protein
MKTIRLFALLTTLLIGVTSAQAISTYSVSGYVHDQQTGDIISGAKVSLEGSDRFAFTNRYGYFCLLTKSSNTVIRVEYPGFRPFRISLTGQAKHLVSVELGREILESDIDFARSLSGGNQVELVQSQKLDIPVSGMEKLPFLFAESDAIKGLQMFPGVDFGASGLSDLFVRGGEAGQNLMMIDGMPIYSSGHLYGYISNFSPNMVSDIQLYKGDLPARYGGRVSSVVDINGKEGAKDMPHGSASISPLTANLHISTPIGQNGSSVSFNWRRTWIDVLLQGLTQGGLQDQFKFGDIHLKSNIKIDDQNEIKISYFTLNDRYGLTFQDTDSNGALALEQDFTFRNTNHTGSVQWNRIINPQLFASFQAGYSGFTQTTSINETDFTVASGNIGRVNNSIDILAGEFQANANFEYRYSPEHFVTFGLQTGVRRINEGTVTIERLTFTGRPGFYDPFSTDVYGAGMNKNAIEVAAYLDDEYKFSDDIRVRGGLRMVLYNHDGYTAFRPEPRISVLKTIDSMSSVKFSYMNTNQFVHLYNNGQTNFEPIIWFLANDDLKPTGTHQIALNYSRNIGKNAQYSAEAYWRHLSNMLIFEQVSIQRDMNIAQFAYDGSGRAYGLEQFFQYTHKSFTSWMGLSLSRSQRIFEDLNRGEPFSFSYERWFNFKAGLAYQRPRYNISTNFIVASGNPYTLPNAKYRDIDGRTILSYDQINNYRTNTYNRLDLRFDYKWYGMINAPQTLTISIYNVFATRNPTSIFTEFENGSFKVFRETDFLFLPALSYRVDF